jgi:hypothetical protein
MTQKISAHSIKMDVTPMKKRKSQLIKMFNFAAGIWQTKRTKRSIFK